MCWRWWGVPDGTLMVGGGVDGGVEGQPLVGGGDGDGGECFVSPRPPPPFGDPVVAAAAGAVDEEAAGLRGVGPVSASQQRGHEQRAGGEVGGAFGGGVEWGAVFEGEQGDRVGEIGVDALALGAFQGTCQRGSSTRWGSR